MAEKRDGTFVRRGIADAGRFAYEGLERIFHEKARLGIMTSLLTHPEGLVFNDLKKLCALTDGNLSRHMQALNEAGLVAIWKGYEKKRPQTLCRLTAEGRKRFLDYLDTLQRVIEDAQPRAARAQARRGESELSGRESPPGWIPI